MSEHEIEVNHVVLHILDTNVGTPVLSSKEIEPDQEGFDFVENMVHKMLADDNSKSASFLAGQNRIQELCESLNQGHKDLVTVSQEMAGILYELMSHQPSIPPADLICCQVVIDRT